MVVPALLALVLSCGSERSAAKTLTDGEKLVMEPGPNPDGGTAVVWPRFWSIEELVALKAPKYDAEAPRSGLEKMLVQVSAYIIAAKIEADGDAHVVISDAPSGGRTMIAEFPSSDCTIGSPMATEMYKARVALLEIFGHVGPGLRRLAHPPRVILKGAPFMDKLHHQTGVAPNGIEIHPCLGVERAP